MWFHSFLRRANTIDDATRKPRRQGQNRIRLRIEWLEDRTLLSTYLVTNTGDNGGVNPAPFAGTGTLRQAIVDANANTGTDVIDFNIGSGGVQTIAPLTPLPAITDPVTINGSSQPGFAGWPIIELDGASAGTGAVGLTVSAGNTTIEGLVINRFALGGIDSLSNGGDLVQGDYVGTDITGTAELGNGGNALTINNSPNNTIGGTTAGARNVLSGNQGTGSNGIEITGSGATGNLVQGNFLGTDVTGSFALVPGGDGGQGVYLLGCSDNTIGGTTAGAGNIMSGNRGNGIVIDGSAGPTVGNIVEGNFIGTNATGTASVNNAGSGVAIDRGAAGNTIGGTSSGARNIISGNIHQGLIIFDPGSDNNVVEGNYIGTDVTGAVALGNGEDSYDAGVVISDGAAGNTIGGTTSSARNILSGNDSSGVHITDSGTTGNLIEGNYIGTDLTGTVAMGNLVNGVLVANGASNNAIGGAAGAGNLIAFDAAAGVAVTQNNSIGNSIRGNSIFSNGALGIDLGADGVTLNDSAGHSGPNSFQDPWDRLPSYWEAETAAVQQVNRQKL
jgi:titin